MTRNTKRRLILYPVALLVLSGLGFAGFVYEAEPDVPTLVNSAEALAKIGLFDKAIDSAEQALSQEPENRYAHVILGYCYGMLEEYGPALDHYAKAVEATEPGDETLGLLELYHAEMLVKAGRPEEGEREAREVLLAYPKQLQAHYVIAGALRSSGQLSAAAAEYRAVEKAAPTDPEPLVLRAEVEEDRDNLEEARNLLARAVDMAPGVVNYRLRKASVLETLGERDSAVAETLLAASSRRDLVTNWLSENPGLEKLRADPRLAGLSEAPVPAEK